jgi:hypothetical protein
MRHRRLVLMLSMIAVPTFGCGGSTSPAAKPSSWQSGGSGYVAGPPSTVAESLFPLVDGHLYHYRMEVLGDRVEPAGMLMMRVSRRDKTHGELRKPAGNQSFEYVADGVATTTKTGAPAYLFKVPVALDAAWLGPHGGNTRYTEVAISVTTPSGSYAGCNRTREEVRGDLPKAIVTTICPDVGIVQLRVEAGGGAEQAELVYYGAPIDIGPDGVTKTTD